MRIIGGEWRGRKIEEPRGRDVTRPTTDRVREACASMVMSAFDFDLDEVRVLDAFGGSGALGLEMLSRGARSLTTFEIDRNAARLITKNIESLAVTVRVGAWSPGDHADECLTRSCTGRPL